MWYPQNHFSGCRLKCWLMVQNQEKDFMQKIFNIEHVFSPQFSYGKNMYTVQLALLLSWCCKDDDPNDYCIVTSLLQGRWISGDDARNHKREGGGIVNCPRCTIQVQMPKNVFGVSKLNEDLDKWDEENLYCRLPNVQTIIQTTIQINLKTTVQIAVQTTIQTPLQTTFCHGNKIHLVHPFHLPWFSTYVELIH